MSDSPDLERIGYIERIKSHSYGGIFAACALVTVLTTIGIFLTLLIDSVAFFSQYPIVDFFTGLEWSPSDSGIGDAVFGIVPLVFATVTVTVTAAFVALPIGTLTAIYLSEYATSRARSVLKPMLEILAGVPTVVYGYFALVYITPALQAVFPSLKTFNLLSASLMVGIMTIPMVSSISEDAMNAVPDDLRQAGYGLGATKYQVSTGIVVPASVSGIVSSYILAISRAIGETMIVVVAAGSQANLPEIDWAFGLIPYFHPAEALFEPSMTITVSMVNIAGSDLTGGTVPYDSMFALGLTLFVVTLIMNVISDIIAQRYREVY